MVLRHYARLNKVNIILTLVCLFIQSKNILEKPFD